MFLTDIQPAPYQRHSATSQAAAAGKPARKTRPIIIDGEKAFVSLTRGYVSVIDSSDIYLIDGWNWCAKIEFCKDGRIKSIYAARTCRQNGRQATVYMHREILGAYQGKFADHKDGDGLNNRKSNLRLATPAQNCRNSRTPSSNSSGCKGVTWDKSRGKWKAQIRFDNKNYNLGRFYFIEDAKHAYLLASSYLHREFGRVA